MLLGEIYSEAKRIESAFDNGDLKGALEAVNALIEHYGNDALDAMSTRLKCGDAFERYSGQSILFIRKLFCDFLNY